MTTAYDEFMRQYRMTGSEKADGYSCAAFDGLNEHEKKVVFDLLAHELPFSIDWMLYIDPKRALEVAREEENKSRRDKYFHTYLLQEALVKYSGNLLYQNHMIQDYPNYAERLKPQVVDSIGRTPPTEPALSFFRQVILTEANSAAVASAAAALLSTLAIPRDTEAARAKYNELRNELCGEDSDLKVKALAELSSCASTLP